MFLRILSVALLVLILGATASRADYASSERWFNALDDQDRFIVQVNLVLVGLYDRYVDGEFGPGTFQAITEFQDQQRSRKDGVLNDRQLAALSAQGQKLFDELGFEETKDAKAGLSIYVPRKVLGRSTSTQRGARYTGADGGIVLETVGKPLSEQSFPALYEQLKDGSAQRRVTYSTFKADTFTLSGQDGDRTFYSRFYSDGYVSSGFSLSWTRDYAELGRMLSIMLANFSAPLDEKVEEQLEEPPAQQSEPEKDDRTGMGSGFFVNEHGLIATNYHVAGACRAISVPGHGAAKLVKGDEASDLAVIELQSGKSPAWASIRSTPPALAESVVLLGYPLATLLDSSLNVSTGIVSAETGLGGNREWFTTNAGIQPGNSGGPILDETGAVIGVAVAKINDAKMLEVMGNVASNVGFGIKGDTLLKFLRVFKFTETKGGTPLTPQQAAQSGKRFTVQVVCEG